MKKVKVIIILFFVFNDSFSQDITKNPYLPDSIPIIYYKNHVYLKGKVDGVPGIFVFDSGASNLYLDSTYYHKNNFSYKNKTYGILPGTGTKPQKVIVILDTVNFLFQKNHYKTRIVPVLNSKSILGDISDGIIGWEYFSDKILEINYEKGYLKIHRNVSHVNLSGFTKIKMIQNNKRFFIPLEIQISDTIRIEGIFLLDLGSGNEITINSPLAQKFKFDSIIKNKTKYYIKYGGVGGESSGYSFIADSLLMGDFSFNNVTMDYSSNRTGALSSDDFAGLLGNGILERFDVLIDFKGSYLYLKPNTFYSAKFEFPKLGFIYVDRHKTLGYWIVSGLYENSIAEKSGLKIDDKIISINNIPVSQIKYEEQENLLDPSNLLNLQIMRGEKMIKIELRP